MLWKIYMKGRTYRLKEGFTDLKMKEKGKGKTKVGGIFKQCWGIKKTQGSLQAVLGHFAKDEEGLHKKCVINKIEKREMKGLECQVMTQALLHIHKQNWVRRNNGRENLLFVLKINNLNKSHISKCSKPTKKNNETIKYSWRT